MEFPWDDGLGPAAASQKPSAEGQAVVERSHGKRAENIAEAEAERDVARLADLQPSGSRSGSFTNACATSAASGWACWRRSCATPEVRPATRYRPRRASAAPSRDCRSTETSGSSLLPRSGWHDRERRATRWTTRPRSPRGVAETGRHAGGNLFAFFGRSRASRARGFDEQGTEHRRADPPRGVDSGALQLLGPHHFPALSAGASRIGATASAQRAKRAPFGPWGAGH